jgi:hypothetical protein
VVRAGATAERSGLRSVSIVTSGFAPQARSTAAALGGPHLALAEYRGNIETDEDRVIERDVIEHVLPDVIAGLTREQPPAPPAAATPANDRRRPVLTGTLDEIQDAFHERLWTDGLPIVPPTLDRVERFLEATRRDPGEVIAVLPPINGAATVWSIAVNGVMAGCEPAYMPLLVGLVEAIADPSFRLQDAGSTPGWEALAIVNGPIRERLGFNFGGGVMRPGRRVNTSVGRFLRLYMRNAAGLRTPPGQLDRACIGSPFNVVLAEDDAACAALGWPTLAETRGFSADQDVVTVQSVVLATPPIYTTGVRSIAHVQGIASVFGRSASAWTTGALRWGAIYPLLVVSPYIAAAMARDGLSKEDVAQGLHERALVSMRTVLEDAARTGATAGFDAVTLAETATIPPIYGQAGLDDLIPVFPWATSIGIVVAGDAARNQSRGYLSNHAQGGRVSKVIAS